MDIEQLRTFERIVREGSFSRAARSLDIAQPSISARIQALEHEVGGPLFVRGGRTLALTELGESFLPYCRRALAVLAEGIEAARLTEHGERGRVTLGTVQSLSRGFVASAVARFHAAHPQVELFIRTGHSDQVVEMLDDGAVKLGLIIWPFFGADLMPLLRFSEPLVLVVAAEHPLAGRGAVALRDIGRAGGPFLLVRWGNTASAILTRIAERAGPIVEVPIETVHDLLLRGIGASFLTRALVADDLRAGRLVEVPVSGVPPMTRESALVRLNRGGPLPAAAERFVEILRAEAGAILVPETDGGARRHR